MSKVDFNGIRACLLALMMHNRPKNASSKTFTHFLRMLMTIMIICDNSFKQFGQINKS